MAGLNLKSMKQGKKELDGPSIGKYKPDPYSYNHRITLDGDALSKLGVDTPKVGDVFDVGAHGHVVSVEESDRANGQKSRRVELQLKKMAANKQKSGKSMFDAVSAGVKAGSSASEED
jgi:hypothetical protein